MRKTTAAGTRCFEHLNFDHLISAALPLIAAGFKRDPAVVASPALTAIVDITGLLIYFTTAKLFLNI